MAPPPLPLQVNLGGGRIFLPPGVVAPSGGTPALPSASGDTRPPDSSCPGCTSMESSSPLAGLPQLLTNGDDANKCKPKDDLSNLAVWLSDLCQPTKRNNPGPAGVCPVAMGRAIVLAVCARDLSNDPIVRALSALEGLLGGGEEAGDAALFGKSAMRDAESAGARGTTSTSRRAADEVAHGLPSSHARPATAAEDTLIPVIGRQPDTATHVGQKGYDVLNMPNWTPEDNDAWIQGYIDRQAAFRLASPATPEMVRAKVIAS